MTTTVTAGNLPLAKVLLSKHNTITNRRDTISYSEYSFPTSLKYIPFSIPLIDLMPGNIPDTITTIFYSSNPSTVATNGVFADFYLDSLELPIPITTTINDDVSNNLELEVFPNPTNDMVTINLGDFEGTNFYTIRTVEGRIVKAGKTTKNKFSIDLSSENNGLYFVTISGDKKSSTHKVIKR
jgi:hypothetical protein